MYFLVTIVLFRLKSLIGVCSAISLGLKVHITALPGPGGGTRACDHIAGGWNNPGPDPGMRAYAPVRGAARRAAQERRTALAHPRQKPGQTAYHSGSARPARSPAAPPRTTG